MAYTVTINYGSGDVELTNYSGENLVLNKSFKKTVQVHNKDYEPVLCQAWFDVRPNQALMTALFGIERDQEVTVSIQENASDWFTGYVRPITQFKETASGQNVLSFECIDVGWKLRAKPEAAISKDPNDNMQVCDTSTTSESLIHWLLDEAWGGSFPNNVTAYDITEEIDYFRTINVEYFELLKDICFSHHASFYFNESGDFVLYNWGESSPSSTATLDEDDMVKALTIKREADAADTPEVTYYSWVTRSGVVVNTWGDPFILGNQACVNATGGTLEWDDKGGTKGTFDVVTSRTVTLRLKVPDDCYGVVDVMSKVVAAYERLNKGSGSFSLTTVKLYKVKVDVPGSGDCGIYDVVATLDTDDYTAELTISWDAYDDFSSYVLGQVYNIVSTITGVFIEEAGTALGPDVGPGTKTYDARFCFSQDSAKELATALSRNLENGEYVYKWESRDSLTVGNYYTVNNTLANKSALVRVVKKETQELPEGVKWYKYEGRQFDGLGVVNNNITVGSFGTSIIDDSDPFSPVSGPELPAVADDDVGPLESGLYLYADKMGYYDATEDEWLSVIENDGSFLFKGDADNYIEWDGADFTIKGDVAINGTIQSGDGIQSSDYSAGSAGWMIDGDGSAEFESLVVRNIDSSLLIDGDLVITGENNLPPGYIYGLETSADTDSDHDVTIATGKCRSYSDLYNLKLSSAITKQIDATWAAGDAAGGNLLIGSTYSAGRTDFATPSTTCTGVAVYNGNLISCDPTEAKIYIHSGITTTVSSSFDAPGTGLPVAVAVDSSGNLYTVDQPGTGGVIYKHSGITSSTTSNISVGSLPYDITFDTDDNLITCRTSSIIKYEGFSTTVDTTLTAPGSNTFGVAIDGDGNLWSFDSSSNEITKHLGFSETEIGSAGIIADNNAIAFDSADRLVTSNGVNDKIYLYNHPRPFTSYHLFLIRKDSDGSIDAGWDTDIDCANIPSGYTAYRRIRSYLTDGSANILDTVQDGDYFELVTTIGDYDQAPSVTTQVDVALSVPSDIPLKADVSILGYYSDTQSINFGSPDTTLAVPSNRAADMQFSPRNRLPAIRCLVRTDTSGQISYRASGTAIDWIAIRTHGWCDDRGQYGGK